jgi:RNA polymerase sigma-70 factor, ECF subfamily
VDVQSFDVKTELKAESRDAVERVWRDQGAKLWRSLTAYSGDRELASDAMAEAFAQALGRGDALDATDRWVWRAAFRIAAGELQRRASVTLERESATEMPEPVVDLVRALQVLSPNQRAAAVLRLYADVPTRDVARIMGCSQATVRVHLTQARRRLRPLLEDADD